MKLPETRLHRPARVAALGATVLALSATSLGAQTRPLGSVVGRVLDAETSLPVPGALVSATSASTDVAQTWDPVETGDDGRFLLANPAPGVLLITVEHPSYGSRVDSLVIVEGEGVDVDIRLSVRPIEIAGLQVTARIPDARADPTRSTRFDGQTSAEVDAVRTRVSSMTDMVRTANVPGLVVQEDGTELCIESNRFRTRQNERQCNMMAVVVDGMISPDPVATLAMLNPEWVDRWEVIPPFDAELLYGRPARFGALSIHTEDGGGLGTQFADPAMDGPRWGFSVALSTASGPTLHDGLIRVENPSGAAGVWYTEQASRLPGLELGARWDMRRFGYVGLSVFGAGGTSTASYAMPGGLQTSERKVRMVGADLWLGLPLVRSKPWSAYFAVGPSMAWTYLEQAGHPAALAELLGQSDGAVDWSSRSGLAWGGLASLDVTRAVGQSTGIFGGVVIRGLLTGSANSAWSARDQEDAERSTGETLTTEYNSTLATSVVLRFGVRWSP